MSKQTETERYKSGMTVRRQVVGDEYVDKALAEADGFTEALQDYVTEFCWGVVWTRPGLDLRTRSLVNLGILASRGQSQELGSHTRGALRNGATVSEIQEVLLQVAVYAGTPTALEAFRAAHPAVLEWQAQTEVQDG
ncbi:MAG TPA: carboxymuconolactone decarboxylase family protein [Acidimicrobiales bacterium]|nr:carboxymuconolactone decarboxylase family protein [Acidimicrobiales bacterium]